MSDILMKRIVAAQALVATLRTRAEEGQGLVEYSLILGFVAVLVVLALRYLQPQISASLNSVANSL